jgi:hypothetical protein
MTQCYAFLNVLFFGFFALMPELSKANNAPNLPPIFLEKESMDSLTALLGHCYPILEATPNCATKTIELAAFVGFVFTGQQVPIVVQWSTGEFAHRISVTPSGSWSYDPLSNSTSAGCEQIHWRNTYTAVDSFFPGPIEIIGPEAACPDTQYELSVNENQGFSLTYQWSLGGTSQTQMIPGPGTYSVTVTDVYSCPTSAQIVIPESVPVAPILTGSLGVCAINDTGFVKVTNQFSTYLWENGDTSNTLTIYEPGTYAVTITNQIGCTRTGEFTVPPGPEVFPVLTGSLGLCSENDNGIVQVTIPFSSYIWDTGQTTNPISVTAPGTYTVTVTHFLGCTATNEFVIPNVDVPEILINMSTPAICPGQFSNLVADFGYSNYIWSNNDLGVSNIVTQAGTYTVTVTNSYGCSNTGSVTLDSLPTPPILINSTPFCPGSNSTITASGAPGIPSYLWSNAQTTNPISVNTPGTYSVTVSGANFCTNTASVVITQLPQGKRMKYNV